MNRRRFLRAAGVAGSIPLAGCLDRLGFEEESAWRDPPMVEDRPDAVYVPASLEGMGTYGTSSDAEYAVTLSYTFPHRFWTITGSETNKVVVEPDDSLHLMVTPWDPQTRTVLPVDLSMEITDGRDVVEQLSPWPMLSQRMGFHYGDNVSLPGEGSYTASIRIGPLSSRLTGSFADRFEAARTLELEFEFDRAEVHSLPFESVDQDRQGMRDAISLMGHDDSAGPEDGFDHADDGMDHESGGEQESEDESSQKSGDGMNSDDRMNHPPTAVATRTDKLPGSLVGEGRSGDARLHVIESTVDRLTDGSSSYLCVFVRTPYNRVVIPFTSISIRIEGESGGVREHHLSETLDDELGHHYGAQVDPLEMGDVITVSVETPPQVARHDGYETAFLEFEPIEWSV